MTDPTLADLRNELREHAGVGVPEAPIAALLTRAEEIKRTRSRWALIAVAAGVLAVIGLGVTIAGQGGSDDRIAPVDRPSATITDSPAPKQEYFTADLVPQSSDVTDADLTLVSDLVAIARVGVYDDPQLEAMKELVQSYPFADTVQLGYGNELRSTARSKLVLPRNWETKGTAFAGYDGVLSVLDRINLFISYSSDSTSTGPMKVFVGDHPRCDGGAALRFPEGDGMRRIAFEPEHTESCLDWFSISLYQDGQGKVAAVTLDLWEP